MTTHDGKTHFADNATLEYIRALKDEVELKNITFDSMRESYGKEIDRLKDENERLREDSERYRFLRTEAYECVIPHGNKLAGKRSAWITKLHPGATFDAAIDAAMRVLPDTEGE